MAEPYWRSELAYPPGGIGLNPLQSFMTPPPTMGFHFMGAQGHPEPAVQQLSPEDLATKPRPHPHLVRVSTPSLSSRPLLRPESS